MSFLYFLEDLRTPFLDGVMSLLTHLGEETILIALALLFFWCIDKYHGYYFMSIGFFGTVVNQFLKILFRIPRPWILDPNFTIVESAREGATGYSFPSGHTQSSVGNFGAIARLTKKVWLRILCIAACVIVPLTRMYLGVHTPLDVCVSIGIALALVFGLYPLFQRAKENPRILWGILLTMITVTGFCMVFVLAYPFPADTDPANLASAQNNLSKLFGAILGMILVYFVDSKYIRFDTKAPLFAQISKYVLGILVVLGVKEGLKPPLNLIFGDNPIRYSIRYFCIVLVAGVVWPLIFPYLTKLSNKLFPKQEKTNT